LNHSVSRTGWLVSLLAATVCTCALSGCGKNDSSASAAAPAEQPAAPAGATDSLVKISQYGGSLYCSIACGADGTLHAIYTDRADPTKVAYLYYRASKDSGATWSEPKNLSDDESGLSAYYCRCMVDGKGRVYAIWKYLSAASDSLDGPGSSGCGILAYRCNNGGTWSKTIRLTSKKVPSTSFFAAPGPDGAVNLVWAQGNPDVDWEPRGGVSPQGANMIQQAVLDGDTAPTPKGLIVPAPIPTAEQIAAAHAAGHDIPYADQYPKSDGLWDLRGYIDASGAAHFIGDHYQIYPSPPDDPNNGPYIVYFDGKQPHKLFEYEHSGGQLNTNNPWTLLLDAHGKEHVFRTPVKAEKDAVRDYAVDKGQLGDSIDVIAPDKPTGKIVDWQATKLTDGRMAVTAALSQKGGWAPDDVDLYISTSTGDGKWSAPVNLTSNESRKAFMSKETAAGGVMTSDSYRPDFAEAVQLKDGSLGVLMVNTDKTLLGITNSGVTGSGQTVGSLASGSTAAPWVFFTKVKG
jgi:hypothetical protein